MLCCGCSCVHSGVKLRMPWNLCHNLGFLILFHFGRRQPAFFFFWKQMHHCHLRDQTLFFFFHTLDLIRYSQYLWFAFRYFFVWTNCSEYANSLQLTHTISLVFYVCIYIWLVEVIYALLASLMLFLYVHSTLQRFLETCNSKGQMVIATYGNPLCLHITSSH